MNIPIYFLFYFLIIFSVIGYGQFLCSITNSKNISENFGYSGLLGLFFLTIYSYISNFFIAHNLTHNSILVLLGLILLVYELLKKNKKQKKEFTLLLSVFLILFISALIYKTHDDFSYYHFAYSFYLTQNSSYIGIGPFNHGFRTQSSIFYMNSLFYLPFVKFYMFHMPAVMMMGFANIILIKKIIENIKIKNINFLTFFSLLSILFINIFFYRLAEHGTDRSAQILIFILIIDILFLINFSSNFNQDLNKIIILTGLVISLKAFYILYLILFVPIVYYLYQKQKVNYLVYLIKNKFLYFFLFFIFLILATNFFNTGCLIYPVGMTCFENAVWAFDIEHVNKMNNWYEQWSKAGAGPNFRVEDPLKYISLFNWVPNWFEIYFFNKVSDFLAGLFLLVLIVYITFYPSPKKKVKRNISMFYILILILFFEWFYNHPALRYGGYVIICSIIFLPIALMIEKKLNLDYLKIKRNFYILIIIGFIIFSGRNIDRIEKEKNIYRYKPLLETYYLFDKKYYSIQQEFNMLIQNFENCKNDKNPCLSLKPEVIKKYGKYIFVNNQ